MNYDACKHTLQTAAAPLSCVYDIIRKWLSVYIPQASLQLFLISAVQNMCCNQTAEGTKSVGLVLDRDATMQQPLGRNTLWKGHQSTVGDTHTHTPFSHTSGLFKVYGLQQETGVPRKSHMGTGRMTSSKMEPEPPDTSSYGEGMEPIRVLGCWFDRWDPFRMCPR